MDYASITLPTLMIGNPEDPVVNFRVKATNTFLKFGDAPNKILYCLTRGEHQHILACNYASPSTVDEITNVIHLFLEANNMITMRRTAPQQQDAAEKTYKLNPELPNNSSTGDLSSKQLARNESAPKGLGSFASYPSFGELTRPLEF